MPTIFKEKKKKTFNYNIKEYNDDYNFVYNTSLWRKLRLHYLMNNPLCKKCLEKDIFNGAVDVHHIIPISSVDGKEEKQKIGFDIFNLEGLCKKCHIEHHKNKY
jgi:5-methylcytosine-specific restriction enzyme A